MGLDIKNSDVEKLAGEVAALMGVTKTEAVRQALEEKKRQVIKTDRWEKLRNLLDQKIWPSIAIDEIAGQLSELKASALYPKKMEADG